MLKIYEAIELAKPKIEELVKDMYLNPELGFEEVRTSRCLANTLSELGFEVTYPYVLKTDYIARYKASKDGPKIGYLCEYDALPEIGHGCGHNLIAGISILAAYGLKSVIDEIGGEIVVIGCPGEENFGGKVEQAKRNVFKDLDVALMLHPSDKNGLGGRSLAIIPVRYEFYGKSAHGCRPYEGHSSLDAAVQTYQGINQLRQFVKTGCFIHGIISNGGSAANVIPEYAALDYYFRAPTIKYANYIKDRASKIANGAGIMCEVEVKESIYECIYEDTKINYTLADSLKECFNEVGILDVKEVDEIPCGSTDVGACSYQCPTIQGNIKICNNNICGHSKDFAAATIDENGKKALELGAKALALLGYKIILDKDLLKKIKKEFNS